MRRTLSHPFSALALALGCCLPAALPTASAAQAVNLPRQSLQASVSQTFAYTTATVTYCRPAVRNRLIWGGVVPFDQVWRAGANEATTIEFTTDVRVEGQALSKGKYALYMIPGKTSWTIIFDKNAKAWGAFTYDGKSDALRVKVAPQKAPMQEWLEYGFDAPGDSSTVLNLRWEKIRVPVTVSADFMDSAKASIARDLSKAKADDPYSWMNAARFYRNHGIDDKQAYAWIDHSISVSALYVNLWTKAEWLAQDKRYSEAIQTGEKARDLAKQDPIGKSQVLLAEKSLAGWRKKARK